MRRILQDLGEEDLRDAMGVVLGDAGIFSLSKVMDDSFVLRHHAIYAFCTRAIVSF